MSSEKGSTLLCALRKLYADDVCAAYNLVKHDEPGPKDSVAFLAYHVICAAYFWQQRRYEALRELWKKTHVNVCAVRIVDRELVVSLLKYYLCPCACAQTDNLELRERIIRYIWKRSAAKTVEDSYLLIMNVSKYFPQLTFEIMGLFVAYHVVEKPCDTPKDTFTVIRTMATAGNRAFEAGAAIPDYMYSVFLSLSFKSKRVMVMLEHATLYFEMCRGMRAFHHMIIISNMIVESETYMRRVIDDAIRDYKSLKQCNWRFKTDFRICVYCSSVDKGYLQCSGCRRAYYCSQACFDSDWSNHVMQCMLIMYATLIEKK